ncbi:MAG TPA: hypothetical protein VN732_06095 [Solirubrobacterales bacterium]|nr:hypothetical protein [Solirubrobacterales bacterium]
MLAALLVPASSAMAAPTGEFVNFAQCPTENPSVTACLYTENTSGYVTTGAKTVPIKNKVILQGGFGNSNPETGISQFYGAKNGVTLSKTPQPVPGGLTGLVAPSWWPQILRDLFNETINNGFTGVQATVELAGPASAIKVNPGALASGTGTAISMPVKIKLDNPFLGSNCYLGSNTNPIQWKFTTGTTSPPPPNTPITGSVGAVSEAAGGSIVRFAGQRLVDNSFATPGANGCGGILFSWAVDPFVNSTVGVPAPAGKNTAVLEGNSELADPIAVKASE